MLKRTLIHLPRPLPTRLPARLPGWLPIWLLAGLLLAASTPPAAADQPEDENLLKAAFVFNFAKYVHWPSGAGRAHALELCLAGDDTIFSALRRLQGERVRGAGVTIRALDAPPVNEQMPGEESDHGTPPDKACDILFVGNSEAPHVARRLAPLGDAPVLTISDIPRFAEQGGVIGLYWEGKKIRFAVNLPAARRAGLRISSRLLNLARIVNDAPPEE